MCKILPLIKLNISYVQLLFRLDVCSISLFGPNNTHTQKKTGHFQKCLWKS